MIRLILVEDHPAVAEGLAALIGKHPCLLVVGIADSAAAAAILIDQVSPDVVLCDIRLGTNTDGLTLLAQHARDAAFVMLSAHSEPGFSVRAVDLGARGYLSKLATIDEIVRAIRTVADGGTAFSIVVQSAMRTALRRPTARELQIVQQLAVGHGNAAIAHALGLQVKTVESQLRRLFVRYDVASRGELVHLARLQGWLQG